MNIDFISDINKGQEEVLGYPQVDRFIVKVLWWHLAVFALFIFTNAILKVSVLYPNPFSWRVIGPREALISFLLALVAAMIPAFFAGRIKNHYHWRILVAVALAMYSYLFVFISGGAIEMHFHFFVMVALIVIYADWRLGWIFLLLVGLHHGILNYVEPGWVYFYGRNDFAVVAHALPVLVAVIFTTMLCENTRRGVVKLEQARKGLTIEVKERTSELEETKAKLELKVKERTLELENFKNNLEKEIEERTGELHGKVDDLAAMNKVMMGRELKMMELKKEIAKLKGEPQTAD